MNNASEATKMELAQLELSTFMGELSEEYYSAGWLENLEYLLWGALEVRDAAGFELTEAQRTRLHQLRLETGGWFRFNDGEGEELVFEDTETFQARYVLWKKDRAKKAREPMKKLTIELTEHTTETVVRLNGEPVGGLVFLALHAHAARDTPRVTLALYNTDPAVIAALQELPWVRLTVLPFPDATVDMDVRISPSNAPER